MFFTHFLINAHLVFFFYPFPEKETREGMRNRKFPWSGLRFITKYTGNREG